MWIAIMLICTDPSAMSCQVLAKTDETFQSEEACQQVAVEGATDFLRRGVLAIPNCFKIGENL